MEIREQDNEKTIDGALVYKTTLVFVSDATVYTTTIILED